MKLIYKAKDITEAHIIAGLLKSNGIETHVGGYYLQGGVGDLAAMDFATIYVANENVEAANRLITEYEKSNTHPSKTTRNNRSIFTVAVIVLSLSIIMMLLLAIAFSDYK